MFLAYLCDPRYRGQKLTNDKKKALLFAKNKYSSHFISIIMRFQVKSDPFSEFLFYQNMVTLLP